MTLQTVSSPPFPAVLPVSGSVYLARQVDRACACLSLLALARRVTGSAGRCCMPTTVPPGLFCGWTCSLLPYAILLGGRTGCSGCADTDVTGCCYWRLEVRAVCGACCLHHTTLAVFVQTNSYAAPFIWRAHLFFLLPVSFRLHPSLQFSLAAWFCLVCSRFSAMHLYHSTLTRRHSGVNRAGAILRAEAQFSCRPLCHVGHDGLRAAYRFSGIQLPSTRSGPGLPSIRG